VRFILKTSSIKAKGKNFERQIRDTLLAHFPNLKDEIRVTIGSENGEDIKLSKKAQTILPLKIECKARARISVYEWYAQAQRHLGELEPVVIMKMNRKKPLVVVDLDFFLKLLQKEEKG
jgi:hypothetical protein